MLARPLTIKPKDWKPPVLGPTVRVEAVHLNPAGDESGLAVIVTRQQGKAGSSKNHGTNPNRMWLGSWTTNMSLEFELPEAVALSGVEVWNYNDEWQTTNGVQKMDVSVSTDGVNWLPLLRDAMIAESSGGTETEAPTILKLNGTSARKVRFENIVPLGTSGKVGLSEVIFHEAVTTRPSSYSPEDGTKGVTTLKPKLQWKPGEGATEHKVFIGTSPTDLALLGSSQQPEMEAAVKPHGTNFWRVDEVQADGKVVTGRVLRFDMVGTAPVAWWKLNENEGTSGKEASVYPIVSKMQGTPRWATGPKQGEGALEFDGSSNYVDCGNSPAFDVDGGITLSVWIKVRKFDKAWQAIVTKGEHAWRLQRNQATGTLEFSCDGLQAQGRAPAVFSKRSVDDGQWHHAVGLYDSERIALYLDGQLEDSFAVSGTINQNSDPVMIGENAGERGRLFNGWLSDLRLYGHGLSEEAVQALYREGLPAQNK